MMFRAYGSGDRGLPLKVVKYESCDAAHTAPAGIDNAYKDRLKRSRSTESQLQIL